MYVVHAVVCCSNYLCCVLCDESNLYCRFVLEDIELNKIYFVAYSTYLLRIIASEKSWGNFALNTVQCALQSTPNQVFDLAFHHKITTVPLCNSWLLLQHTLYQHTRVRFGFYNNCTLNHVIQLMPKFH